MGSKPPKDSAKRWLYNRKRRQQQKARDKLPKLLAVTGGKCHYCSEPLIQLKTVAVDRIVKRTDHYVTYRTGLGDVVKVAIATVDHVVPLMDGGTSDFDNLVPACGACNHGRHVDKRSRKNLFCPKCGKEKEHKWRRKCLACRAGNSGGREE